MARAISGGWISGLGVCVAALGMTSCDDGEQPPPDDDRFASSVATLLDFEFDGEFVTSPTGFLQNRVRSQLLYTIGQLNGDNSVGRLDQLEVTNLTTENIEGGLWRVRYHAVLPVAWGSKTNLPTTYEFNLPTRVDSASLQAFTDDYSEDCVDWSAHDVSPGSMWYYYRPEAAGCNIADGDTISFTADITVSDENTTGKYPEYHKVWEDDELEVVAIFGKYEDGATENSDAGISAYNRFSRSVGNLFDDQSLVSTPADLPYNPGIDIPEITYEVTVDDGRLARVTLLLVDNVRTAPASFDQRYGELSADADLIFYNGHAGLGANIRALSQKGTTVPGKYQIFFMNGCDTFAYIDNAIAQAKMAANPDDTTGTKYLDMITNAMPSYFRDMSGASVALIWGLAQPSEPRTYEEMFDYIPSVQVVLVTGEEDNVYFPGFDPDPWEGMNESGSVRRRDEVLYEIPNLSPGRYLFELSPVDPTRPGDADLYVDLGQAPTTSSYTCASRSSGTDESCEVELDVASSVFVMVRGWNRRGTDFDLTGARVAD